MQQDAPSPSPTGEQKPPTGTRFNALYRQGVPFNANQDFEDARRGLIASLSRAGCHPQRAGRPRLGPQPVRLHRRPAPSGFDPTARPEAPRLTTDDPEKRDAVVVVSKAAARRI